MDQFLADTIYIAVIVLLPLVPAILLYRVIPSKGSDAEVSGPLQGFSLKLKGGIASYFAILLVTSWIYARPVSERMQLYTFTGYLQMDDSTASALIAERPEDWKSVESQLMWSVVPPNVSVFPHGKFELQIPYSPEKPPFITVELGDCQAQISTETLEAGEHLVVLEDYDLERAGRRTIEAGTPIVLRNPMAPPDSLGAPCGGVL